MLIAGIDLGTSSIKVSIVDAATANCLVTVQYPDEESPIISRQPRWAEQDPEQWWQHVQQAILKANSTKKYNPKDIAYIGIAYQMHGLVLVDKNLQNLRDAIIWCDSRAVSFGEEAFQKIGATHCLTHLLNSPGNFTASKLAWVKKNEPAMYAATYKAMLPGDYIAMKFTGNITTTPSALSEGILWDFTKNEISKDVLNAFGFDASIFPTVQPVYSNHGQLLKTVADPLGLSEKVRVTYKAGDQPNNALSLNVTQPGEVAATAGTSGVIYAVSDQQISDPLSRVNSFAHINHTREEKRIGVLLCINACGIFNRYVKEMVGSNLSYDQMNELAATVTAGADNLRMHPFGNGAERMLNNQLIGASMTNLQLSTHTPAHLFRAAQEGIAFAFRYGLDIMRENLLSPSVLRVGKANLFLSPVFAQALATVTQTPIEVFATSGSIGAAIGAGIGGGLFKNQQEAFQNLKPLHTWQPQPKEPYETIYINWKNELNKLIAQ